MDVLARSRARSAHPTSRPGARQGPRSVLNVPFAPEALLVPEGRVRVEDEARAPLLPNYLHRLFEQYLRPREVENFLQKVM